MVARGVLLGALVASVAMAAGAQPTRAQVADMSGTWRLNVAASSWGKHPKPSTGTVTIEHREPVFQYSGGVVVDDGSETTSGKNDFSFDGAIDGKEYPVRGAFGTGKMSVRRVNPSTTVRN